MSRSDYFRSKESAVDYKTSAFVGGGSIWVITTQTLDNRSFSWIPIWQHQQADPSLTKPWKVEYQAFNDTWNFQNPDVLVAIKILRDALTEIHHFAINLEIHFWPSWLEGNEGELHHNDLCPNGVLSKEAKHLLYACQTSRVFGGMGSWNDIYETGHAEYPRVSKALFGAVNYGITSAVNNSARSL